MMSKSAAKTRDYLQLLAGNFDVSEILTFLKRRHSADVTCLPNFCEDGMIPWPGYPNECFQVNKEGNPGFCRLVKIGDEVTCGTIIQGFANVLGPTAAKCEYGKMWSVFINQCVKDFR